MHMSLLLSLEKSWLYLQWAAEGDRHQHLLPDRGLGVKGGSWRWHCGGSRHGLLHWDGHRVGGAGAGHWQGHHHDSQGDEDSSHCVNIANTILVYLIYMKYWWIHWPWTWSIKYSWNAPGHCHLDWANNNNLTDPFYFTYDDNWTKWLKETIYILHYWFGTWSLKCRPKALSIVSSICLVPWT